ncbi:nuclear transport factor 2 family protein [Streptomyces sp. NPDC049813]|uniref:nuclear transport factor 2 family protein n=1 Tax=Streptomyces sp. NPDC049813 TaxID=3365597 RepID=UPI0037B4E72A
MSDSAVRHRIEQVVTLNHDGNRVASRWVIHGRNFGVLATEPDGRPISVTGTAVWAVSADGRLQRN